MAAGAYEPRPLTADEAGELASLLEAVLADFGPDMLARLDALRQRTRDLAIYPPRTPRGGFLDMAVSTLDFWLTRELVVLQGAHRRLVVDDPWLRRQLEGLM